VTFTELQDASSRFANLLHSHGIGRGDTVAGLLPRIPELLVAVLGTWRVGAIYQPLFTAFGPAAIEHRLTAEGGSQAKLIVTDAANRPKLDQVPRCPPVLLADRGEVGSKRVSSAPSRKSFLARPAPPALPFTHVSMAARFRQAQTSSVSAIPIAASMRILGAPISLMPMYMSWGAANNHFWKNGGYGIQASQSFLSAPGDFGSGANANTSGSVFAVQSSNVYISGSLNAGHLCTPRNSGSIAARWGSTSTAFQSRPIGNRSCISAISRSTPRH
jgi:hypothetical protein